MRISGQVTNYVNFLKTATRDEQQRNIDIRNGELTQSEWEQRYEEDTNKQFEVLTDEWRNLASKKNKTPEEIQRMQDLYREGFQNFGAEFVGYIDQEFGDGNGLLSQDEYINYEVSSLDKKDINELGVNPQVDTGNIFAHMDRDKSGDVDAEEMAATLAMFDMDVKNGGINGKIKVYDLNANVANMVKPSYTEGGAAMDEKVNMMYNFLFNPNK